MKSAPTSLILITVDCLRADHVGFSGYQRATTPFLDSLAKESFVFSTAIAAGMPTYYSLPAILASRYPLALGRDILGIAPNENTLASVLKEHGYRTAAFAAANPYISSRFGYDQGYDCFRDFLNSGKLDFQMRASGPRLQARINQALAGVCHSVPPLGKVYDELYFEYCQRIASPSCEILDSARRFPSADVIVNHAIAWLKQNSCAPFFLWLHLMDPHGPYYPKAEALAERGSDPVSGEKASYLNSFWSRHDVTPNRLRRKLDPVIGLYDAGIRWADTQIRRLTESLVDLNVWDSCALAITADHGEEFLEHGGRFHAPLKLTEELIRVPLLLRAPELSGSREISSPFGLIDLAPTLLDCLGFPTPASFRGRSCWELIVKGEAWERPVFTECIHGCTNPFLMQKRVAPRILSVRKGHHKLIVDFSSCILQLFDLKADPAELTPLNLEAAKPIRRELLVHARKFLAVSQKSRDFESRLGSQLRELRIEWAHPIASPN